MIATLLSTSSSRHHCFLQPVDVACSRTIVGVEGKASHGTIAGEGGYRSGAVLTAGRTDQAHIATGDTLVMYGQGSPAASNSTQALICIADPGTMLLHTGSHLSALTSCATHPLSPVSPLHPHHHPAIAPNCRETSDKSTLASKPVVFEEEPSANPLNVAQPLSCSSAPDPSLEPQPSAVSPTEHSSQDFSPSKCPSSSREQQQMVCTTDFPSPCAPSNRTNQPTANLRRSNRIRKRSMAASDAHCAGHVHSAHKMEPQSKQRVGPSYQAAIPNCQPK
jgi:hypothetical protein